MRTLNTESETYPVEQWGEGEGFLSDAVRATGGARGKFQFKLGSGGGKKRKKIGRFASTHPFCEKSKIVQGAENIEGEKRGRS